MWSLNALLVYAPFFRLGIWFDEEQQERPCIRYREGKSLLDRIYAHMIFAFGWYFVNSEPLVTIIQDSILFH